MCWKVKEEMRVTEPPNPRRIKTLPPMEQFVVVVVFIVSSRCCHPTPMCPSQSGGERPSFERSLPGPRLVCSREYVHACIHAVGLGDVTAKDDPSAARVRETGSTPLLLKFVRRRLEPMGREKGINARDARHVQFFLFLLDPTRQIAQPYHDGNHKCGISSSICSSIRRCDDK